MPAAFKTCGGTFDLSTKEARLEELDEMMARPDFWDDQEGAEVVSRERIRLIEQLELWKRLNSEAEDCQVAFELLSEVEDPELRGETESRVEALEREVSALEFQKMLSGENDENDAILSINAGAGGTEAQDWAEMLFRMYMRWAEAKGYDVSILDRLDGEEAGIKSATLSISGNHAYGFLRSEQGVHRLVRISPYDSQARRHTSFASVSVLADVMEDTTVEVDEGDLKVDVFRASGAGGQHVNKTESAVRLTHIPTGIVVSCQSERSQHKNRANAMRILKARIKDHQQSILDAQRAEVEAEKKEIAWGSQIRSYILQPYQKVKDHRTGVEDGNVTKVLDGGIDEFIEGFLLGQTEEA
ncbi:MAG: peptide chain release factor 2 [Deltaproteobacteria bacterium]|nr:MAG: peptide chain release factor 2 [Deltaproteobacteria bacterium]